ncbi:MAG: phospholipid carrier-dependent glycosyltransferase [Gammaproteobacteria bacterium]|nr:MAG: phospholipid carrier-dependent glycosyltransferase [Gammaproteobacteria bacterium]
MAVLIVLALAPLWVTGMFGRGLWTPDEPREADIAWRMSRQSDRTLPQLAGTPFLEKPPLSYWMSGAAISLFGDSAAAERAPNLLYAAVTAVAVGALALAMDTGAVAALIAALVAASALTAFRVGVWLAPDACLLAGNALALLGAWRGTRAPPGPAKAAGYTLMHLGAAVGFMAKSAPGWLVPAMALLTLIVWERRWSELRRWELYAGLALQGLIIGPWVLAVARSEHGADALRALFWNNVVGRFTRIDSPAALDYTLGHRNAPGKYLFELPFYLLPWTPVVAAALVHAWRRVREPDAAGTAWRFALGASLPFLAVLSLAATARDIYAAPAILGLAALAVLILSGAGPPLACLAAALGAGVPAIAALLLATRSQQRGDLKRSLLWSYTAYAAAVSFSALALLPVLDRWQDLPGLARRIHADCARAPLALLDPDETTIAVLDHGLDTRFTILTSDHDTSRAIVTRWFSDQGREARVLILVPGHARGALTRYLEHFHAPPPESDGVAGSLTAAGAAALVRRYELPQGRRYALLGPPPPP